MNNISSIEKCANCGACYNVCPVNAIEYEKDGTFYELNVNTDKCINCGLCLKVCPILHNFDNQNITQAIGGFHKDKSVVLDSSSGGAFNYLATKIIKKGGIIYGACFDKDYKSVIFKSSDECDIKKIQKSKYVESFVGDTFKKIKLNLEKNRLVLFCGAPCQVAGLKNYLKKDYINLYTCDFSCGGMPSHNFYKDYINYLEKKYSSKVALVDFRPKTFGWRKHALKIVFENGKIYSKLAETDPYYQGFIYKQLTKRDYCYECKFSNNHVADFILADYWLSQKYSKLIDDDTGISLVIFNSDKAKTLFENESSDFYYEKQDIKLATYNIKETVKNEKKVNEHKRFISCYETEGFECAKNKYLEIDKLTSCKLYLKYYVKRMIKWKKSKK